MIEATIVLHNILIDLGDDGRQDWNNPEDIVHLNHVNTPPHTVGDPLFESIPNGAQKDERRHRIKWYLEEHIYF